MTSEVAIMNKLGMALAADSAITSGRDEVRKVYHSANKLFSLSNKHPIGIMVYGAASFMEVPWDIIIKTYREYLGNQTFRNLPSYLDSMLEFLKQDKRFRKEALEEVIIYRTFSDLLKELVRDVEEEIQFETTEEANRISHDTHVKQSLAKHVEDNIQFFQQKEEEFLDLDYAAFKNRFQSVLDDIIEEVMVVRLSDALKDKLYVLAYEALKKDYFSIGSTGFVISGYGDDDIFPRLLNYRLEGFVFGQLKYKKITDQSISYTNDQIGNTASIIPFAQREMVDSFMYGIEPVMEDTIFSIIHQVFKRYHEQIEKYLDIEFSQKQVNDLKEMGNKVYQSMEDAVYDYQHGHYIEPLLGVVRSLPKEELADMAEALVNLTTFKQRVTRTTESVAPPVDVAVITKGDGFVWMRRKNTIDWSINE